MKPYRWYYFDVVAGDLTAVVIFMQNPVFSARTLAAGLNVAVYKAGKRVAWVMTDYASSDSGGNEEIRVGRSHITHHGKGIDVYVSDRTPFSGRAVSLHLTVQPLTPPGPIVELDPNHAWQAIAPRARATLTFDGEIRNGLAYHDSNWGGVALGSDVASWTWSRTHGSEETVVRYFVDGRDSGHVLHARADRADVHAEPNVPAPRQRSGWGLSLPEGAGALIESAPFYARLHKNDADADCLTEVADFARFRSAWCRWMPYFRSRREAP